MIDEAHTKASLLSPDFSFPHSILLSRRLQLWRVCVCSLFFFLTFLVREKPRGISRWIFLFRFPFHTSDFCRSISLRFVFILIFYLVGFVSRIFIIIIMIMYFIDGVDSPSASQSHGSPCVERPQRSLAWLQVKHCHHYYTLSMAYLYCGARIGANIHWTHIKIDVHTLPIHLRHSPTEIV